MALPSFPTACSTTPGALLPRPCWSAAHFKRLTTAKVQTTEVVHSQDRVRIKDKNGKTPPWPTDQAEHAAYSAMQDLLFDAIWRRSSDVKMDLIPERQVKIVYKIDGVERSREPIDPATGALLFGHLKRIGGMSADERRKPQQGNFKAIIGAGGKGDKSVDVDVKTSGSTAGERMVLKLFSAESKSAWANWASPRISWRCSSRSRDPIRA